MFKQVVRNNPLFLGRAVVLMLLAGATVVPVGCATTSTPEPSDALTISCRKPGHNCSEEADQACPSGYKILSSRSNSGGERQSSSSPGEPSVRRTTLVIECTNGKADTKG